MLHQSCLLHHENLMPLRASPSLEHHWVNYLGSVILLKITGPFWDQKLVIFNTTPKSLRENHLEISWCGQNGSNVLATSLNLVSHVLKMYVEKKCSNRSIHKGTEHMIRMEESSYPLLPSFGFALPSDLLLLYPVLARVATYSSAICWRNRIDEPVPQMPW